MFDDKISYTAVTFDDVLLEPRYSEVVPSEVDVSSHLTARIALQIPMVSSPMDTVTESEMAIGLAKEGGLGIIHKNITKLSGLIDQLFEYSKLEARQIEPRKEAFAISDLAYDVFEKYQQLASEKSLSIQLDIEEKLPLVFADISLVERVIQNLMDNALKFTPEGGSVTIAMGSNEKEVHVAIKDTGVGIASDELTQIFERYKQVSTSTKSKREGAGLGLAIAKKIMEIHDSTIKVISRPQEGTTFQFYLPVFS